MIRLFAQRASSMKLAALAAFSLGVLIFANLQGTVAASQEVMNTKTDEDTGVFMDRIQKHLGDTLTARDIGRLSNWGAALIDGEFSAKHAGKADELERRSPLFRQKARVPGNIPEGVYNCAITKLGTSAKNIGSSYIAYPSFKCMVTDDGDRKHFLKMTGSQLTTGWIYSIGNGQYAYVGTSFYGYENVAVSYGRSEERDNVAIVEKIGASRWRMVFPYPYYESAVDVMELTPVK